MRSDCFSYPISISPICYLSIISWHFRNSAKSAFADSFVQWRLYVWQRCFVVKALSPLHFTSSRQVNVLFFFRLSLSRVISFSFYLISLAVEFFLNFIRSISRALFFTVKMEIVADKSERVNCPFDPVHVIERRRLQAHIIKCKRVSNF